MSAPVVRELTPSERAAIRRLVVGLCANYDTGERLCLPLDCPCYMLHKWWTGSMCRYFCGALLPADAKLEISLSSRTDGCLKSCPVCGAVFRAKGHQRYCSDRCSALARRQAGARRVRNYREKKMLSCNAFEAF